MTFSWATIRVRNLEDSLAFYHNLLGLPIHDRFGPPGHQIVMLGTPARNWNSLKAPSPCRRFQPPVSPWDLRQKTCASFCPPWRRPESPARPLCPPIHPFVSTSYKIPTGM